MAAIGLRLVGAVLWGASAIGAGAAWLGENITPQAWGTLAVCFGMGWALEAIARRADH